MGTRALHRCLLFVAALCLAALGPLAATPAYAAPGDQIEKYAITYTIAPDGRVDVSETIDMTFGSSGRHGFERTLVTRERWDDKQDATFPISNISVTSPTGAPTQYTVKSAENGSDATTAIRIGDPDRYVDRRETYVLKYSVAGAMRPFADHDEFSWDATGFDWKMPMRNITVDVTGPRAPQETICFAGPVKSTTPCTSKSVSVSTATFTQSSLPQGQNLTVAIKLPKGAVTNPNPRLVPNAAAESQRQLLLAGGATGLTALLAPLVGLLHWRRNGRDERYVGLAPGTVPLAGAPAATGPDTITNIPVAFSPPRIPVGEAGLLIDGAVDIRDTTATLIDLAVRGALTLADSGGSNYRATLRDPGVAAAPHEVVLLNALFRGAGPGASVELGQRGTLTDAHEEVSRSLRSQVTERQWFRRIPGGGSGVRLGAGSLWIVVIAAFWFFPQLGSGLLGSVLGGAGAIGPLVWILPLIPVIATVLVVRAKMKRGQRTAQGRAVTDQIEGFRTYLATAEANQLKFEEGEDIFSKYLPWAIMLDLAERWATLCEQLVRMGRIPEYQPTWYAGHYSGFNVIYLNDALAHSSMPEPPAPSTGSSGSGFGGGSSFGGGGFSGGGGGGGGGDSW
ncbi:DUF2207 domain-containing protein [Mariniluteicoccus flavus]